MNLNKNIRNQAIIFSIVIILVFSSIPISTIFSYNYQKNPNKEETAELKSSGNTWTVDDDGSADFNTIQAAVDAASSGDIIKIHPGTYTENIEVYKSLFITSASEVEKPIVQPLDKYEPVFRITANEVNVSMIEIDGGGGYYGFYLDNVQRCYLFNILATSYKKYLVFLLQSSHNTIKNINFSNGYYLIGTSNSHYNTISDNFIKKCQNFIHLSGDHNIISNNFIERSYNIGGLVGSYNKFVNNTCYSTGGIGIGGTSSKFNIIESNELKRQYMYDVAGIYIYQGASNNIICNNRISEFKYGVTITTDAYENVIVNNTIVNCNMAAVNLESSYNYIYSNDFINGYSGITIRAGFNYIYSNNFINSEAIHIIVYSWGISNYWHSPTQLDYFYQDVKYTNYLGNYFDDYDGMDDNNDGLGDTPYDVHHNTYDKDEYPLMIPYQHYRKSLPKLNTKEASDITGTAVTLNGEITSIGGSIIWKRRFEWGTTPECGEYWTDSTSISLINEYDFNFRLTDLEPDTTYYFRAWVKNSHGWNKAEVVSFTTYRAPKDWTVDDDEIADFSSIQEAIDVAIPGDSVLVYPGVYTENNKVNKILTIKSVNGYESTIVKALDPRESVFEVQSNYVSISGFTVKDAYSGASGIYVPDWSYCTITSNYITNNQLGISLLGSTHNVLKDNQIILNDLHGIYLHGIYLLQGSSHNKIINNTCSNNDYGISIIAESDSNEVIDNLLHDNYYGIWLRLGKKNRLIGNEIYTHEIGIYVDRSNENEISNNILYDNNYAAIMLYESIKNIITDNTIFNNENGFNFERKSNYNEIFYNDVYDNNYGIRYGGYVISPSNPSIYCTENTFYMNNFMNIISNLKFRTLDHPNNYNSLFDLTYYAYGTTMSGPLGNYWNDYSGGDNDGDGVGDDPYIIFYEQYGIDNYPLIQPFQDYKTPTIDTIPPKTEIEISPWRTINFDDVRFTWTGKDDITPSYALKFQYKLEGYDEDWSKWTTQNSVTYYDLPYGEYTFWVMARDLAGNVEDPPKSRVFTYFQEKESIKSLINEIKSDILDLVDKALFNYGLMMLTLKDLVENNPEYSPLKFTLDILQLCKKTKDAGKIEYVKSFFLEPIPQVPKGLVHLLDIFKVIQIPISILNIMLSIMEQHEVGKGVENLISYEENLAQIYDYLLNNEVDIFDIYFELHQEFAYEIKNVINSAFNTLLNEVKQSAYIDSDYLESLLWDIKRQLTQARDYDRKLLILGDKKYSISALTEYKTAINHYYDSIQTGRLITSICSVIGTATTIAGLFFTPTDIVGAICRMLSFVGSLAKREALEYTIDKIQSFYSIMLQGTYSLFNLFETLKQIAFDINEVTIPYLNPPTYHYDGKILSIVTRHVPISTFSYKTYFDVTISNQGTTKSRGKLLYHVRSIKEDLNLADVDYTEFVIEPKEIKTITLKSILPISYLGGNYIAAIELWLGPKMVEQQFHKYYVENIGGLLINEFEDCILDMGESISYQFESIGNSLPSIIFNEYGNSEINLHIYDSNGNHLGINYISGEIEREIPGAKYSGPLPSHEWAILPPGLYEIVLMCVDADMEGEGFTLSEITFFPSPGILGVTPSRIDDYIEPGTTSSSLIILQELSQQHGITDINIIPSKLTNSEGVEIEVLAEPTTVSIEPGGNAIVELEYSIPLGTPLDIYQGTITIIGTELGNGELLEFVIPISLEVEILFDNTPPSTSLILSEPNFLLNGDYHLTENTIITLLPEDNMGGSGIASTIYRIYNESYDSGWTEYLQPFCITNIFDGDYSFEYYSIDLANNQETSNCISIIFDNHAPDIIWPNEGDAFQDGTVFTIKTSDLSPVQYVKIKIRERGTEGEILYEELLIFDIENAVWNSFKFDTTILPDGYYELIVEASDIFIFTKIEVFEFSIRNWAILELLPATRSNKPGRTMPVKFSLRVAKAVDPSMPFVVNGELCIIIYDTSDPSIILQESFFGDSSKDYRIDTQGELYITNFKTSKTPAIYMVEIWRNDMLIGSFTFSTMPEQSLLLWLTHYVIFFPQNIITMFFVVSISIVVMAPMKRLIRKKQKHYK